MFNRNRLLIYPISIMNSEEQSFQEKRIVNEKNLNLSNFYITKKQNNYYQEYLNFVNS